MTSIFFVTPKADSPARLVAEAEIHFGEGLLAGTKLSGFAIWKSPEGELYVTVPSRPFGSGTTRRFFDFVRLIEPTNIPAIRGLKDAILAAWSENAAKKNENKEAVA